MYYPQIWKEKEEDFISSNKNMIEDGVVGSINQLPSKDV